MGDEYVYVSEDRTDLVKELLTYTGLTEEQKVRIAEAEAKKAAKKAAAAAKKAAAAAEAAKQESADSKPEDKTDG